MYHVVNVVLVLHFTLIESVQSYDCFNISDNDKRDCGWVGIKQPSCELKGCYWCESKIPNIPWCFHKQKQLYNCTKFYNTVKQDCHIEEGATRVRCEQRGCYWCETDRLDTAWCFDPSGNLANNTSYASPSTTKQPKRSQEPTNLNMDKTPISMSTPNTPLTTVTKQKLPKSGNATNTKCAPIVLKPFSRIHPQGCLRNNVTAELLCIISCVKGFQLNGPSRVRCLASRVWDRPTNYACIDVEPPFITCPENAIQGIEDGHRTAVVNYDIPLATDNSGSLFNVYVSIQPGARLTLGNYTIIATAVDDSGLSSHCSFTVNIMANLKAKRKPKILTSRIVLVLGILLGLTTFAFIVTCVFYLYSLRKKTKTIRLPANEYVNPSFSDAI